MANPNAAVQFYGIRAVLDAYENRQAAPFVLWWGSQLLIKYEGKDLEEGKQVLGDYLRSIMTPDSVATYKLTVYDKLSKEGLNSRTPYDGSFNFKLHDPGYATPYQSAANSQVQRLEAMIEELREELNQREAQPEKPAGIMGVVSGLLENPQVQQAIVSRVIGFVDQLLGVPQVPVPQIARVGAVDETNAARQAQLLHEAWEALITHDPQIGEHLKKLAALALSDPQKFQSLVQMINML
jgi:hypothetical protein